MKYMLFGVIAITIIDIVGSIASQKLKFNFAYLTPLSLIVYTLIGYYTSLEFSLTNAIITNAFIGLYDGTIGLKLTSYFKANIKLSEEEFEMVHTPAATLITVVLAIIFALVGYYFSP